MFDSGKEIVLDVNVLLSPNVGDQTRSYFYDYALQLMQKSDIPSLEKARAILYLLKEYSDCPNLLKNCKKQIAKQNRTNLLSAGLALAKALISYQKGSYKEYIQFYQIDVFAIPETCSKICKDAFRFCKSLTSVIIPESIQCIEDEAFWMCEQLSGIVIPASVKSIGNFAFYLCQAMTNLTISNGVCSLGYSAFCACYNLLEVNIPKSVKKIADRPFHCCYRLENILVDAKNPEYKSIYGVLYTKDEKTLIQYPIGRKNISYTILPGVTTLAEHAFSTSYHLVSVTVPSSVKTLNGAFSHCYKLVELLGCPSVEIKNIFSQVMIPGKKTIDRVGDYLFFTQNDKNYLLTYVGRETDLVLPENYKGEQYDIFPNAFAYCSELTGVTFSEGVEVVSENAFNYCDNLMCVNFSHSITELHHASFANCQSLTSIVIPSNIKKLSFCAFSACSSLIEVSLLNSMKIIEDGLFEFCKQLQHIELPDGVETIGPRAFTNCSALESIVLPESIKRIEKKAFINCTNLKHIYFRGSKAQWDAIAKGEDFDICSKNKKTTKISYEVLFDYTGE